MRRKFILFMFSCFHVFMFSCSNEQELKPEVKILQEDWHGLANVKHVALNEPIQSIVQKYINENELGKDYSLSFSKETFHFLTGGFSQVFTSLKNSENYLVVSVSITGDVHFFYMKQFGQVFTFSDKESSLFQFDANEQKLISAKTAYPGNCNALGGPQAGESYGDCFLRNWNNFCCDFSGCAAQIVSGQSVAIAIGLSCGPALF